MKITKIECVPLFYPAGKPSYNGIGKSGGRPLLLVRVYTDTGLVGIGEAATYGGPMVSTATVIEREIAPAILGEDPLNLERIWHKCYFGAFQHARSGIYICALSGVDIALWDLVGKALGQPIYKLLGGYRDRIQTYASGGFYQQGKDARALAEELCGYADLGFQAVKMKIGRTERPLSVGELSDSYLECHYTMEEDLARVETARKALGKEVKLMVDANAAFTYPDALEAGRFFDSLGVYFFEEPLRTDDYEGSARLAAALDTRVAGYETEQLLGNYARMIQMRAVDLVQPDLSWAGGFTECRKIAAVAGAAYMECAVHTFSSAILLAASLQFSCGIPNGAMVEYDMTENALRTELLTEPILPDQNGVVVLGDRPGLGIELDEAVVERYRVTM